MKVEDRLVYQNGGNTALLAMIPSSPGRILDAGCGAGDNAALLKARGWQVTAVTIDPAEKKAALPFCDDIHLGNLEEGLPDAVTGIFDVVLMSHVLEHLAQPGRLLEGARKRLTANGIIAVALPNVLNYRQRLSFLRGKFEYSDTGILDRTHLRFYTYNTGRALLEEHGFEVIHAVPDGSLPVWRLRSLIPAGRLESINRWACQRRPDLLAYQSLFIAKIADLR
jgi:SAM-dependent methyltransferase